MGLIDKLKERRDFRKKQILDIEHAEKFFSALGVNVYKLCLPSVSDRDYLQSFIDLKAEPFIAESGAKIKITGIYRVLPRDFYKYRESEGFLPNCQSRPYREEEISVIANMPKEKD